MFFYFRIKYYSLLFVLVIIANIYIHPKNISAIYDPLSVSNNKYGVHIVDTNDLEEASKLINSNGGDWGYITLVIQNDDLNLSKWQGIFNRMRKLHLIPIVRLATKVEKDYWEKPQIVDIDKWVDFLNSINWPIQNRYIIIFNEPNHAKEWGNDINPEEYAEYFSNIAVKLKEKSDDFFILSAALDTACRKDPECLDAELYFRRMFSHRPEFFNLIDGLNSHSYPNPDFSASPYTSGKGSIRSFEWEILHLKNSGLQKNLPIFITETGWKHKYGKYTDHTYGEPDQIGKYMQITANSVWSDYRIAAVTPFIFNYQDIPFDHFSFKKINSNEYYPHYDIYLNIPKKTGAPLQRQKYSLENPLFPNVMLTESVYTINGVFINDGQNIFDQRQGYELFIESDPTGFKAIIDVPDYLEPQQKSLFKIHIETPNKKDIYNIKLQAGINGRNIMLEEKKIELKNPPELVIFPQYAWKNNLPDHNIKVLIYDQNDQLVHKYENPEIRKNSIVLSRLNNTIPGEKYRLVILSPFYLPSQKVITIPEIKSVITGIRLWPLDLDQNGMLNWGDLFAVIKTSPMKFINLIF